MHLFLAIVYNHIVLNNLSLFIFLSSFPRHHFEQGNTKWRKTKILYPFYPLLSLFYCLHSFIGAYKLPLREKKFQKIMHSPEFLSSKHRLHNTDFFFTLFSSLVLVLLFILMDFFRCRISFFRLQGWALLNSNRNIMYTRKKNWIEIGAISIQR